MGHPIHPTALAVRANHRTVACIISIHSTRPIASAPDGAFAVTQLTQRSRRHGLATLEFTTTGAWPGFRVTRKSRAQTRKKNTPKPAEFLCLLFLGSPPVSEF